MYESHLSSSPLRPGALPLRKLPILNEGYIAKGYVASNKSETIQNAGKNIRNLPSQDTLDAMKRGIVIKNARFRQDRVPLGSLTCNGVDTPSEVIYWRSNPADDAYISPVTPHRHNFDEKYFTFEYDSGGWNNVRLSLECLMVVAHAMGRTVVLPPAQRLYLLSQRHKDADSNTFKRVSGINDFYNIDALRRNQGMHLITMKEFLTKEAVPGRLKGGLRPPGNDTSLWGAPLWSYIESIADTTAHWANKFVLFPSSSSDRVHDINATTNPRTWAKFEMIAQNTKPVVYSKQMQEAKVLHIPGTENNERIVKLFYG
jgi:hypothetical protein